MIAAGLIAWARGQVLPIMGGALLASTVALGVQSWRVSSLKADVVRLTAEAKASAEAARLSDALRGQEQAQDKGSYADQGERCEQRVTTALEAARAIEEVTNERNAAPAGPARPIVGAGQLRRIIGQGGSGAAGLPAGSDGTARP